MGFVGSIVELLWVIPQYTWRVCSSAITSLTLIWEFFRLVIKAPVDSGAPVESWTDFLKLFAMRALPDANLYILVIPALLTLLHYMTHALLTRLLYFEKGQADRMVWAGLSTGIALGWTILFWKLMPGGRLGIVTPDPLTIGLRVQMLLSFVVPYFFYAVTTGLTSSSRPGGFFMRKFIPAFAVMVFVSGRPDQATGVRVAGMLIESKDGPGAGVRLAGWLIRVLIADAISDMLIPTKRFERATFLTLIVWTMTIGNAFNEHSLYLDNALGLTACVVIVGMAFWAYVSQIKGERRRS